MISVSTARALAATGLEWEPARGDRFIIPDRGMDDEVFVLSDMTVETHDFPTGRVIGFNGTTEWALDSVDAASVLWLPGEGTLRGLLGPAMVRLEPAGLAGWAVTVADPLTGGTTEVVHPDAEEAYGLALLAVRARTARHLLPLAAHRVTSAVTALAAPPARWHEPSRAAGRTHLQVLAHLVEEHRWVRGLLAAAPTDVLGEVGAQVAAQEEVDPVAEDPAGTWRRAIGSSLAAWEALPPPVDGDDGAGGHLVHLAAGPTPVVEYAEQVLLDLVVHAWDLGAEAGDPAAVRHVLDHLRTHPDHLARARAAGLFAEPVALGEAAGEEQRLLALTGRRSPTP